ncbi:TRAP transporter small permease [Oceanicella sp. SM1341]|uniref:TRAP transporter small permease n=1 Tax=Oceanicella sp. SM1341 TaxID=1548889 RepID=UPI000E4A9ABD|nr:TRAP transporter small permease [Oceanicella sp. SM1341]
MPRSALDRLLDGLSALVLWIAGAGLVLLIAIFGWLVWGRYVMNSTPTWVEQLALLLVVFISFLGAAVVVHDEGHLSVDFFRDALPPRGRLWVSVFNDLVLALFALAMAWFTWQLVLFKWRAKIPLLGWPEGLRSLPLVVCGVLVVLFCGARILRRLRAGVEE